MENIKTLFKIIINFIVCAKPMLVKIIPIEFLRKAKKKIVSSYSKKLAGDSKKFDRSKFEDGISLVGPIRGETGLGESCRLVARAVNATRLNFTIYNYEQISAMVQTNTQWDYKITNETPYNINLVHLNPPDLTLAKMSLQPEFWDYKYNIGFWLWELEKFPTDWMACFDLVDEIWTPADFITEIMRKYTAKPVRTIHYPLKVDVDETYNREYFDLPTDKFLYMCLYDCNSIVGRKNPKGSIDAFKRAFDADNTDVGLVVKVNHPQQKDLEILNELCEGRQNIHIIAKTLEKIEVNSLINCIDVLVSMHRAEGFGLPLAEAMYLGKPTVGTNWSANTEFMNEETSCLVPYELSVLKENVLLYEKGSRWADPNVEVAAEHLVKLYADKLFYNKIAENGQKFLHEKYSLDNAQKLITARVQEIYKMFES